MFGEPLMANFPLTPFIEGLACWRGQGWVGSSASPFAIAELSKGRTDWWKVEL